MAAVVPGDIKIALMETGERFKTVPPGDDLRVIAAERLQACAAALRDGSLSLAAIERLSGLSRQTLARLNPVTGEVRWDR